MIIDDSNLLQIRLSNALRKVDEKMSISRACTCKEAAALFSQFEPDTVILDIARADASGINLLQRFKKELANVHVKMLTIYFTEDLKINYLELRADFFFD